MAELPTPKFANINLDLVKLQAWIPQRVFATVGDTGYAQIFSLYENGTPYNSATVSNLNFRAIKPDNNMLDITGGKGFTAIEGEPNKFIFMVPKQTFASEGRVECYFYIADADGNTVASTTHFFYDVQRSVPSETDSISYIASLEDVVKSAKDLETQAMGMITEITANKNQTDKDATDFAVDLKLKQQDAEKQADQMLADTKTAMEKATGDATDYQTKLDNLNKQYLAKYNELLSQLPDASDAVKKQIGDALAQLKDDEQDEFQQIEMDWVKKKETLTDSITAYQDDVKKQLDNLKQQIAGISSENVQKLSDQIDALQKKLASLNVADFYTKKEIDDKLDSFQPKIDLSGYETTAHAEDTYAKKSDLSNIKPDMTGYAKSEDIAKTYETKSDASTHLTKETADETYAQKSDIPDLTGYETKADADQTYAKKSDITNPDLSGYETSKHASETYETKADAETTYAKKADIPDVSGFETTAHASETYAKKSDIVAPDLSDYAKKSDIPASPDLSGYETTDNADKTFAKKTDIPDVSGFETTAHASETYAKKSDIPKGQDLSAYETKEDAEATYAKKADIVAPDLSDYAKTADVAKTYETKADAEQTYAKKTDIVNPDLSDYETKTDADATYAKKIDIPAMPDLSGYAKKSDIPAAPDLSGYETSEHADETYAKKTDIPDTSSFATKQDVTEFAKSEDVAKTYETKADASSHITKEQADADYASKSDLANVKPDMSGYVKSTDLAGYAKTTDIPDVSGFETKTDADNTYAKKADIPVVPDLSTYLTKTDADATYAKKSDISDPITFTANGKEVIGNDIHFDDGMYLRGDDLGRIRVSVQHDKAKPNESTISFYMEGVDKILTQDIADGIYAKKSDVTSGGVDSGKAIKSVVAYNGNMGITTFGLPRTLDLDMVPDSSGDIRVSNQCAFPSIVVDGFDKGTFTEQKLKNSSAYESVFFYSWDKFYARGHRILTDDDLNTTLSYAEKDNALAAVAASNSTNPTLAYCSATNALYFKGHKLTFAN